jgi:hypothetical protein
MFSLDLLVLASFQVWNFQPRDRENTLSGCAPGTPALGEGECDRHVRPVTLSTPPPGPFHLSDGPQGIRLTPLVRIPYTM